MATTMLDQAVEAAHLAEADPARFAASSTDLARRARRQGDLAAASVAERALGIAALHLQHTDAAMRHLRAAADLGRRAGSPALVAEARLRLAAVLNVRGRPAAALREIDAALDAATGVDRSRGWGQRGAILLQLGRLDPALESLERALPGLRAAGDRMWLKRVLANRGLVHARRFRFAAAEADLREALRLNRELGLDLSVAFLEQNLGWLYGLQGDVPRALEHLDRAEGMLRRLGAQVGFLLEDRAGLLLSVGLVAEARLAAEQAVTALVGERQRIALPDVRLLEARAAVLEGDRPAAEAQARRAAAGFGRQRRPEGLALARSVVVACRAAGPDRDRIRLGPLHRTADQLDAAGYPEAAVESRLLAAELAAERSGGDRGAAQLARAAAARARGPAAIRALGWQAEAVLRLRAGRPRGAMSALAAGLRVLDVQRAGLGATDLRAHSGRQRVALTSLGLAVAVRGGRPADILAWAEHGRASHLLLPPLRPPEDPGLAADLAELRSALAEVDRLRRAGGDPGGALRHQVAIERRVRDRVRRVPAAADGPPVAPVGLAPLGAALGPAALVEYVEVEGGLHALTVVGGRASWSPLGPAGSVRELAGRLPFALRRLAGGRGNSAAARALLGDAAARLDARLLAPLAARVGDRPLVVVPTGRLRSLPWSLLPSCRGRPVTVAPSATTWHAARAPGAGAGTGVVVIAGPGLPGGREEAAAVAALHGTVALRDGAATVDRALAALAGADVAHLATHGRLHREHPLFSALELADGPLTGYDLERLRPVPRLVVLAGCDTARHGVPAGEELLGLTATFLARGARQVVASVLPVPDNGTVALMTAFHRGLVRGRPAAEALAEAQATAAAGDDAALAAAAGFLCVGGEFTLTARGAG